MALINQSDSVWFCGYFILCVVVIWTICGAFWRNKPFFKKQQNNFELHFENKSNSEILTHLVMTI